MVLGPRAAKALPYLNFAIASSALFFQTGILYPWHNNLDDSFGKLQEDQKQLFKEYHGLKDGKLEALSHRITGIETRLADIENATAAGTARR